MTSLKTAAVFLAALGLSFTCVDPAAPYASLKGSGNQISPSSVLIKYHDANSVKLAVSNAGQIGNDLLGRNAGGFWPKETRNNYIYGAGLWIGGLADVDGDGDRDTLFLQAYDPGSSGSEFDEGRYGQSPDDPLASVFSSSEPADLATWPEEFIEIDRHPESPTYGQMVPDIMSDQDLVTIYNSVEARPLFATPSPPFEVRQRSLAFRTGNARQVIFFIFDIENLSEISPAGPFSLEEAWVGFESDMDIGSEFSDDRTSIFRNRDDLSTPEPGDSLPVDMAFAWDQDFSESNFKGDPGFAGIVCLQSPGNDEDGLDNDGDGMVDESPFDGIDDDGDGLIDDEPDEVDQLGLVNYTYHDSPSGGQLRNDPTTDQIGYRIMSCTPDRECVETTNASDVRFLVTSGPFTIRPGETHCMVVAFVFADAVGDPTSIPVYGDPPRPDPNDIYFEEFLAVRQTAQYISDLGFRKEAGPPPRPAMSLIPGDGRVAVLWDSSPVHTPDEMYYDFAALDSSYRQYDFEGFRLWRSRTGKFSTEGDPEDPLNPLASAHNEENPDLDLALLGQWDLSNGITTESHGIDTLEYVIDEDSGRLVVFTADTFDLGTDTGLRFSFLDRGDPAAPLVNGLRYYYSVESYDYNSNEIPLASLSAGNGVVFSEENSTMPRSDATSFISASGMISHVDDLGNPLPDSTPADFVFDDPPLASDALRAAQVTPYLDSQIPDAFHEFVIEDIVPDRQEGRRVVAHYAMVDASGRSLHTGGDESSHFTIHYDTTASPAAVTVFDPADTTVPLYELAMVFESPDSTFKSPPVSALTAVDAQGNDVKSTLGNIQIPLGASYRPGFRGTDITMTWHEAGTDSLTLSVYDTGNRVTVPPSPVPGDSVRAQNWYFDVSGDQPGGMYLIGNPAVFRLYMCGTVIVPVGVTRRPEEGDAWTLRQRSLYVTAEGDTIPGSRPLVPGTRYRVNLTGGGQDKGEIDLAAIRVVPNPYLGYSEFESGGAARKIQFVNLPPECTIRIYTISGILVRVLAHTASEAGTESYDLMTREGLPLASGNYYYHVTVPDGRTHLGRFAVIQ